MALDKIQHVVTLMLENRSFDNLLGKLYPKSADFDGLAGDEVNLDAGGHAVRVNNQPGAAHEVLCVPTPDPGELWTDINEQIFGAAAAQSGSFSKPAMSGFATNYLRQTEDPTDYRADSVMHYFTPDQVPVISELARTFAVCDRWFASAPCQTWPNRFFVHTATGGGHADNVPDALYKMPTIFEQLHNEVGSDAWRIYFHDIAQSMALSNLWVHPRHFSLFDRFLSDASTGNLPAYAFIEPRYFPDYDLPNDQHPPHNVSLGEGLVASVYNALRNGPAWTSTLLIITYDEHGGCYDHVAPPSAAPPGPEVCQPFNFDRYGVRVPTVIVSPYIKPGTILRPSGPVPFDHTSIAATLRKRFGLSGPLSKRDAVAPHIGNALSLEQPENLGPQRIEPITVDNVRALTEEARPKQVSGLQKSLLMLSRTLPESTDEVKSPEVVHARRRSLADGSMPVAIQAGAAAPEVKRRVNQFLGAAESEIPAAPVLRPALDTPAPPPMTGAIADPGLRFLPPQPQHKKKIAFAIGNAAYRHVTPLKNTVADANGIRDRLSRLGFDVYGGTDCGLREMSQWFDDFIARLKPKDTVVLYYSGHGVQVDAQNMLVPVDCTLATLQQPPKGIQLQHLVDRIFATKARQCLVILDACRDNPFIASADAEGGARRMVGGMPSTQAKFASHGLAPLEVVQDAQAFIAFAAEPGRFAYEGEGPNGRFTGALLRHIETEGLNIDGLMQRVGGEVKASTKGRQRPWSQSNLTENFYFRPATWAAVYTMGLLGLISGLLTAIPLFVLQPQLRLGKSYFAGMIFAAVASYGVWRWGRRSLWGAALCFGIASLSWMLGMLVLDRFGTFSELSHISEGSFLKNAKVLRDILAAELAGLVVILGCVFGGAITTPSLRRPHVYVLILGSGLIVGLIYVGAVMLQIYLYPGVTTHWTDYLVDFGASALWQGLLGACIGYGLSQYVPAIDERRA
jgi:phospholipase C